MQFILRATVIINDDQIAKARKAGKVFARDLAQLSAVALKRACISDDMGDECEVTIEVGGYNLSDVAQARARLVTLAKDAIKLGGKVTALKLANDGTDEDLFDENPELKYREPDEEVPLPVSEQLRVALAEENNAKAQLQAAQSELEQLRARVAEIEDTAVAEIGEPTDTEH